MLIPANAQKNPLVVNGRPYGGPAGAPLDVPDFDAGMLEANGWARVAPAGPTSARPTGALGLYQANNGAKFFDATLSLLIEFTNGQWINPATGSAV